MSRRGSRSPDISAIEDRVIAQSERAAEAAERERRFANASMMTSWSPDRLNEPLSPRIAGKAEQRVERDPCARCGVRKDRHDDAGFGHRWRG